MEKTIRVCDECGKSEEAGNHWFQVAIISETETVGPQLHITAERFVVGNYDKTGMMDVCGQECLVKAVAKWAGQ